MRIWKNLILILYVFRVYVLNKIESLKLPSLMVWKPVSSSQLLLLVGPLWICIAIIICLASYQLACVFVNKYTLAVAYNKIFPILLAFSFKELEIICKPKHMKSFQTILLNTFSLPRLMFLQLARCSQVSCSHAISQSKQIYFSA